jgi:hypothetical protein
MPDLPEETWLPPGGSGQSLKQGKPLWVVGECRDLFSFPIVPKDKRDEISGVGLSFLSAYFPPLESVPRAWYHGGNRYEENPHHRRAWLFLG